MQVPPFSLSQQIDDLGVDLEEAVLEVLRSGQYIGEAVCIQRQKTASIAKSVRGRVPSSHEGRPVGHADW